MQLESVQLKDKSRFSHKIIQIFNVKSINKHISKGKRQTLHRQTSVNNKM